MEAAVCFKILAYLWQSSDITKLKTVRCAAGAVRTTMQSTGLKDVLKMHNPHGRFEKWKQM
jgi:hypothetical protein